MKKLVIMGAGGLGREVAQYVKDINLKQPEYELLGFIDDDPLQKDKIYNRCRLCRDEQTACYDSGAGSHYKFIQQAV